MPLELPKNFQKKEGEEYESGPHYATLVEDLPPLKQNCLRLVHIASPEAAERIVGSGFNYESQGMISSTTRAYSGVSDVEYSTTDPRFNQSGMKVVVIDMPADEYRLHNDPTKSPGIVPPEYIVGVVDLQER